MKKTEKPPVFARLQWDTTVPTIQVQDNDMEAFAALMALGGFPCSKCQKPLHEKGGYICCHSAHCPYCGVSTSGSMVGSQGPCNHLLYRNTDDYWAFEFMGQLWQRSVAEQNNAHYRYWEKLLQPTPPGRRLPGQKGPGYPHWTDAQKAEAYPDGIHQHLETIFTPTLRTFSAKRLHPVLLPYVRPEIRTRMRDIHGHRHDYYFLSNPDDALKTIEDFLIKLEAGTQKLRATPPEKIIRVTKEG